MTLREHRVRDRRAHPAARQRSGRTSSAHSTSAARADRGLGRSASPAGRTLRSPRGPRLAGRRRGEDHPARRLLDHVAVMSPTKRSRGPPRPPSSARRARGVGSSAASTIASTPRRRASSTIAWPTVRAAHHRRRDLDALVLLADRLRPRAAPARAFLTLLVGHARVDRQRHRDLEHVQRLDHRAALVLVGVLGREPAGGPDDVVVERLAEDRHEDRCRTRPRRGSWQRLGAGSCTRFAQRLALGRAVDDVERDPDRASRRRR